MKNKAGMFLVAAVGLVVVLGCGKLTELANKADDPGKTEGDTSKTFTLARKEWTSRELEQTDIKVDLPGAPVDKTPKESLLPPNFKEVFSAMHVWSYDNKDFDTSYSQLVPTGKRKFEIKFLADTSMASLKKQLPDLTYTLDIKSDTNAKYNGAFTKNGKNYDIRGCCVYKKGKDARVWAVLTLAPKFNTDAQTASKRIIESVVFKDSAEECE